MPFPSDVDLVNHVQHVLNDVCFGSPAQAEADIARHFSPDYVQVTDGNRLEYKDFVAHIKHLRGVIASGIVEVHEVVRDGDLVADRHTMRATKVDGGQVVGDCYAFTQYAADGRILRVHELSHIIAGSEADQNLGHAR
jgi:ketosteroid isomerase-like protein